MNQSGNSGEQSSIKLQFTDDLQAMAGISAKLDLILKEGGEQTQHMVDDKEKNEFVMRKLMDFSGFQDQQEEEQG